jgi:hypothetical protein
MKHKGKRVEAAIHEAKETIQSPIDLWRLMGGKSHKVGESGQMPPVDSMLAIHEGRATYTFILDDEVASIHFDLQRGEIFFKGHNIAHLDLTSSQKEALIRMKAVLAGDPKAQKLYSAYCATLDRCLADKYNEGSSSQAPPSAK